MSRMRRNGKILSPESSGEDLIEICSSDRSSSEDLLMIAVTCAYKWWPSFELVAGVPPDVLLSLIFQNPVSGPEIWMSVADSGHVPRPWNLRYKVFSCIGDNPSLVLEVMSGNVSKEILDFVIVAVYIRCMRHNSSFRAIERYFDGPGLSRIESSAHGRGIADASVLCAMAICEYSRYKSESMHESDSSLMEFGLPPKPSGVGYEPSETIVSVCQSIVGG